MCIDMTTPTQVEGAVVCGSCMAIVVVFSCGSRATIEQVEVVSTIFVKNVNKIFCFLAFILDSRWEYGLRTRALLSRHMNSRCDVAHPTPRGGERLDFVGQKIEE